LENGPPGGCDIVGRDVRTARAGLARDAETPRPDINARAIILFRLYINVASDEEHMPFREADKPFSDKFPTNSQVRLFVSFAAQFS